MQHRPRPSPVLVRFGPLVVLAAGLGAALVAGCEKTRALAGAGQDCDLAIDCLPGLVCVDDEATGRRVCSSDLTSVQGEAPPDGAPAPTPEAGADGAPTPTPDAAGTPDAGSPQDSGQPPPPQDAAANG